MANLPTLNIGAATASSLSTTVSDVTVTPIQQDQVGNQEETIWQNHEWTKQWGFLNDVAEFHSAMIMKSIWNVGKSYQTDPETQVILDNITGWGKDTFDDILFNMDLIRRVGGDSYAEIMRDEEGTIINLKPLDPGAMKIILNKKGVIIRYEQHIGGEVEKFNPKDIFHLSHKRLGDQIHGISDLKSIEKTISAEFENFDDMKKIMHRQAKPMIIFKLKTDDTTKINAFIAKMDAATNKGENIYVPDDENTLSWEVVQIDITNTIIAWRTDIRNKFYRAVGLPQVIFGSGGTTESGGKIEYLAHEQVFSHEQRYLEKQIWNQLALKIKLNPPTSLLENLQTDENKDANQGMEIQPNDMMAGRGK